MTFPSEVISVGTGPVPGAWGTVLDLFGSRTLSYPCSRRFVLEQESEQTLRVPTRTSWALVCLFQEFQATYAGDRVIADFFRLRCELQSRLPILIFCNRVVRQRLQRCDLFQDDNEAPGQLTLPANAPLLDVFAAMSKLRPYRPFAFEHAFAPYRSHQGTLKDCICEHETLKERLIENPSPEKEVGELMAKLNSVAVYLDLRGAGHLWNTLQDSYNKLVSDRTSIPIAELAARQAELCNLLDEVLAIAKSMILPL